MSTIASHSDRDALLDKVDDDYARFFLLKVSDFNANTSEYQRLADFCHAAFFSIHAASFAWLAASLSQQDLTPNIGLLKICNLLRRWRGLPSIPIPDGSVLEIFRELIPLLEILDDKASSDLRLRRVLQTLEIKECGALPPGKWTDRTSHRIGFSLARDVLYEVLLATIGPIGIAEGSKRNVPRYDKKIVETKHWPHLQDRLKQYAQYDLQLILRSINHELARGFEVDAKSQPLIRKTNILYVAADSANEAAKRLRLDMEVRAIQVELQAAKYRDQRVCSIITGD